MKAPSRFQDSLRTLTYGGAYTLHCVTWSVLSIWKKSVKYFSIFYIFRTINIPRQGTKLITVNQIFRQNQKTDDWDLHGWGRAKSYGEVPCSTWRWNNIDSISWHFHKIDTPKPRTKKSISNWNGGLQVKQSWLRHWQKMYPQLWRRVMFNNKEKHWLVRFSAVLRCGITQRNDQAEAIYL